MKCTAPSQVPGHGVGFLEGVVRASDLDLSGLLGPCAVLRWFQDGVWLHAENLGLGQETLHASHLAWVIVRQEVRFASRMPSWNAPLALWTWPCKPDRLFYYRDYLLASQGQEVARCSTSWIIMDLKQSRQVRPEICNAVTVHDLPPIAGAPPARLRLRADELPAAGARRVCGSDLDPSGHLNHIRAAEWLLDLLSPEQASSRTLSRWTLNYLREARPGELLTAGSQWRDERTWEAGLFLGDSQPSVLCCGHWAP